MTLGKLPYLNGNLLWKCIKSYGDLTLMNLSLHWKSLAMSKNNQMVERLCVIVFFSHMPSFFTIEVICIG